jgi:predicted DNA-binding protein (UPF0251 family)
MSAAQETSPPRRNRYEGITGALQADELEALRALRARSTARECAKLLGISPSTVDKAVAGLPLSPLAREVLTTRLSKLRDEGRL